MHWTLGASSEALATMATGVVCDVRTTGYMYVTVMYSPTNVWVVVRPVDDYTIMDYCGRHREPHDANLLLNVSSVHCGRFQSS